MIRVFKQNQGRKTESLKRLLLQYIQNHELKTGDQLPSQAVLRKQLGLSGTTIIRAIKALEEEHILCVRDKVGTFVAPESPKIQSGCVVGLLTVPDSFRILPQYYVMTMILQNKLFSRGCQPMVFPTTADKDDIPSTLRNYPKLESAISQSNIDAVVDFSSITESDCEYVRKRRIPYFRMSAVFSRHPGIYLDTELFFRQALDEILADGRCTPMLITSANPPLEKLWKNVLHEKLPDHVKAGKQVFSASENRDGIQLAMRLKECSELPDSFVFLDDSLGMYFLTALDRIGLTQVQYDPLIISTSTAELPLLMPRDNIIYYEINLNELMEQLADMVENAMDFRKVERAVKSRLYPLKRIGYRPLMNSIEINHNRKEL